jgi:hypothetical protein
MADIKQLIEQTRTEIAEFEKSVPMIEAAQSEHAALDAMIAETEAAELELLKEHSGDTEERTHRLVEIRCRRDVLKSNRNGSVEDAWEESYRLGGIAWQSFDRLCAYHYSRAREAAPDKAIDDRFSFGMPRIEFGEWVSKDEKFARRRSIVFSWEQEFQGRFARLSSAILAMEGEPAKPITKKS